MTENRSLDEFRHAGQTASDGDGDSGNEGVADSDPGGGDEDAVAPESVADSEAVAASEDVEPPRATYRWSPEGTDCPACGATVERQWRDGDRFVCADCKEW